LNSKGKLGPKFSNTWISRVLGWQRDFQWVYLLILTTGYMKLRSAFALPKCVFNITLQ